MEQWKEVTSTNGLIEVSSLGNVRRKERPITYIDGRKGTLPAAMMRPSINADGYCVCSFSKKKLYVHRLVSEAFLDEPEYIMAKQTVNHKNGIKSDNRVENLEWATYQKNSSHARETNLNKQHGERTNLTKYTDQFIDAVRNVHAEYAPNYEKLGKMFGITGSHARQIVLHETRKRKTVNDD